MSVTLALRIPETIATRLAEVAEATDRPKTYHVVKALEAYLADLADYQVALDRLRDKDDPVISSADLRKRLAAKD